MRTVVETGTGLQPTELTELKVNYVLDITMAMYSAPKSAIANLIH
jgi:hypothetical protein